MPLRMKEIIDVMTSKNGDELFESVVGILNRLGISMYNEDGSYKDTYTLICEIAKVWNKDTK